MYTLPYSCVHHGYSLKMTQAIGSVRFCYSTDEAQLSAILLWNLRPTRHVPWLRTIMQTQQQASNVWHENLTIHSARGKVTRAESNSQGILHVGWVQEKFKLLGWVSSIHNYFAKQSICVTFDKILFVLFLSHLFTLRNESQRDVKKNIPTYR